MKYFTYLLISLLLLVSCHSDDTPSFSEKTVIVYIAGDNSLSKFSSININQMEKGLPSNNLNLIVYVDTKNEAPKLLKIRKDQSGEVKSKVVKEYEEHNSADPTIVNKIITEAKQSYPAQSYGLILWSHGTSWLPPKQRPKTRSFGEDNGREIDIKDLPKAIPDGFDYIIFDACWMASVEVLYELRNKTPYILSSPIEVLGEGLPYEKVVPLLFDDNDTKTRLIEIAETFYRHYNKKSGEYQTAASSLIKTSEMEDLARETRKIISQNPLSSWDYHQNKIQKLDRFNTNTYLFDFEDFLDKNYPQNKLRTIKKLLENTVIYERHTANYLGKPLNNLCGLSCYVPTKDNPLNSYYKTLSWTEASGFDILFE